MADFVMPSLGAGMERGVLAAWRCAVGDRVERGQIIAEVETEKGLIEVEVFVTGTVRRLLVEAGADVPVGTPLAEIDEAGAVPAASVAAASVPAASVAAASVSAASVAAASVPAASVAAASVPAASVPAASVPAASVPAASVPAASMPAAKASGVHATPGARQLARERGVPLEGVHGSGRHGTVTRADLTGRSVEEPSPSPSTHGPGPSSTPGVRAPVAARAKVSPAARRLARSLSIDPTALATAADGAVHLAQVEAVAAARPRRAASPAAAMRRAIAHAMSKSKREIPHYYLAHTVDLGPATDWLAEENAERGVDRRLVMGALLLSAVARAVRVVPELNAHWLGEAAPPIEPVHLGVAITLRGGGLIAPAIHDAADKSLDELMASLSDLVTRARRGALRASELADPTITVTSLGERGVEAVIGVIHPPQVAMVGFGRVVARPWVVEGQVLARPTVTVTLAADHRVSDGHRGGLYLAEIERLLMHPEEL